MSSAFRVIAHRGASAHAPENTLPAFERALDLGAHEVELDVRFSADEEIVVFHDDTLDRKTDRRGRVRHYSAADLRRTEIGRWFDHTHPDVEESFAGTHLVDLDQVLSTLGDRVHYHIEMKGFEDWLPLRLLQAIDGHGLRDRVMVTSFSLRPLQQMRRLCDSLPLCLLLRDAADALRSAEFRPQLEGRASEEIHDYWIDEAAESGMQQVGVRARDLRPRTIARAADRGLEVRAWGIRDRADLEHVARLGAVGATVDWPGRALEILAELGFASEGLRG